MHYEYLKPCAPGSYHWDPQSELETWLAARGLSLGYSAHATAVEAAMAQAQIPERERIPLLVGMSHAELAQFVASCSQTAKQEPEPEPEPEQESEPEPEPEQESELEPEAEAEDELDDDLDAMEKELASATDGDAEAADDGPGTSSTVDLEAMMGELEDAETMDMDLDAMAAELG